MKRYLVPLFFWLIAGTTIFGSSLLFAHVRQTQAVVSIPTPNPQANTRQFSLLDANMPGSVPYLAARAQERAYALAFRPEEMPLLYVERASRRIQAADYAWQHGESQLAVSALHKAHVYLHRAMAECQEKPGSCEEVSAVTTHTTQDLLSAIDSFQDSSQNEAVRGSLIALRERVQAMNLVSVR